MMTEDDRPQTPEWMLTYADMVTLLLTIFVMLVSMGELKQTDKFQGVADSLHEQFGNSSSGHNMLPGELRPRNPLLAGLFLSGRALRTSAVAGGNAQALTLHFDQGSAELSEEHAVRLRQLGVRLSASAQRVEIRALVAPSSDAATPDASAQWEAAYRQAQAAARLLIAESKIEPGRIRIAVSGSTEKAASGPNMPKVPAVTPVEIVLLRGDIN